ncbi:hypothetical protein AHF37_05637 [Paragonimus kellicotti]|nr:hypothetical protein AHF37_05637 [Paragonimus kellicotti]
MQQSWQPYVVFLLLLFNCHSAYLFDKTSLVYKSRCLNGFSCDQTRCLKLSFRCDGKYDCVDRTDELHCDPCKSEQVQCSDGACIQRSSLCDRIKDCSKGEDENPDFCLKQKCPGEFLCRVTLADCVKRPCSDKVLCPDYTDQAEEFCTPVNSTQPSPMKCSQMEFACLNRLQCIHEIYHCDGYRDCEDGSDEFGCDTKQVELLSPNEFVCQDGLSIPKDWVCDQKVDCPLGDDEQVGPTTRSNCTITMFSSETESQSTICPSGTFACGTISTIDKTHCITMEKVCDGVYDCPDYTDETTNCASPCDEQTQFFCHIAKTDDLRSHDPICIPRVEVCDGYPNCPNGDDEATGPRTGCESLNCTIRNGGCSQLCTVIGGRVKCDCHSGYIRSPDNPRVCIAIGEIRILYVDNGQLYGRDLKDTGPSRMLQIKIDPNDLTEQIRWAHTHISHSRSNSLNRMLWSGMGDFDYSLKPSSDGSTQLSFIFAHNGEWSGLFDISTRSTAEPKLGSGMLVLNSLWTLFTHGSNTSPQIIPHSFTIAFDWVHDLVYWTNGALRTIGVIDRKRGWRKTLAELPASSQPLGIVVDPRFGRFYWVNRGRTMTIEVMDMDGQVRQLGKLYTFELNNTDTCN